MALLDDLKKEQALRQEQKAGGIEATPLSPVAPRLGPTPELPPREAAPAPTTLPQTVEEPKPSEYKAMDPLSAGVQAVSSLFAGKGVKGRDYPYAYGVGTGGFVSALGKGAGIAGREIQKLAASDTPLADTADLAFKAMKPVAPQAAAAGQKLTQVGRDVKESVQVEKAAQDPRFKMISSLGQSVEEYEKPTMALGARTEEFYTGLLSDEAKALKNTPWYKAEGLGAKFISALLQATESLPQTAVTAVVGAPIMGTLKATGAVKTLANGFKRMGMSKKWAGRTADWLSEGAAFSTPEGMLAGLSNAKDLGDQVTKMTHEELTKSPKYMEHLESAPIDMTPEEQSGYAKKMLIEDLEVFTLASTLAASTVTGMVTGGGMFGSAGASKSFIMRRVLGATKEGFQEFFQSGPGEKAPANLAIKMFADPDQEIMEGVWEAAAAGAGPGALMGGVVGSGMKFDSPEEVAAETRLKQRKLRDKSIKVLREEKISDEDLIMMMQSPEALAQYNLQPSDLDSMVINRQRALQELMDHKALVESAPTEAIRRGLTESFTGQAMALMEEKLQPGRPDDGEKAKPEAGQAPETAEEVKPTKPVEKPVSKERVEVEKTQAYKDVQKAKQEVLELYSKRGKTNLWEPKTVREDQDNRLKAAEEKLKVAQGVLAGEMKTGEGIERRTDVKRRKTVEEMTPDEMKKELLINDLTNIPNKRALKETMQVADEAGKPKSVIFIDADSLKTINDLGGHEAGDALLKSIADAIKTVDPDLGFHISGDEFVLLADNPAQAAEKAKRLDEALASKEIEFTLENGDKYVYSGLGASYGIAETVAEADRKMGLHKIEREKAGTRVGRGEQPPGLLKVAAGKSKVSKGKKQKEVVAPLVKGETIFTETTDPKQIKQELVKAEKEHTILVKMGNPKQADKLQKQINVKRSLLIKATKAEKAKAVKSKAAKAAKVKAAKAKITKKKVPETLSKIKNRLTELKKKLKSGKIKTKTERHQIETEISATIYQIAQAETEIEIAGEIAAKLKAKKAKIVKTPPQTKVEKILAFMAKTLPAKRIEFITELTKAKKVRKPLQWIAKNATDESYRNIAKRILKGFPSVDLEILEMGQKVKSKGGAPKTITARGTHRLSPDEHRIFLKGVTYDEKSTGMNEEVFLHECIHAVTAQKIRAAFDPKNEGTEIYKVTRELAFLQNKILDYLNNPANDSDSPVPGAHQRYARVLTNIKEVVTYGMTDPVFQEILRNIPYEKTTVWNKFVQLVAKILGVDNTTALGELIRVTDKIVETPLPAGKTESAAEDLSAVDPEYFNKVFDNLKDKSQKTNVKEIQEAEKGAIEAGTKSKDPAVKKLAKIFQKLNTDSTEFKRTKTTQTTDIAEGLFGLPEYTYKKDEAANRVLQEALAADEMKYTVQTHLTGNFGKVGERIQNVDPEAFEEAGGYLRSVDRDGISFGIQEEEEDRWSATDLTGQIIQSDLTEDQAVQAMLRAEQKELQRRGFSANARIFIWEFRQLTNRTFDAQIADLRQQIENAKRYGVKEPLVGDKETQTISKAIATIGDLRGSFFPRERPDKTYIVRAQKEGEDNVLLTFDAYLPENEEAWDVTNKIKAVLNANLPIGKKIKELQAQGYTVTGPTLSPAPSESVYDAPGLVTSMDALMSMAEESSQGEDTTAIQLLNQALVKKIAELFKVKGSLSSRARRAKHYVTGFETDPFKAAMSHVQRVTSGIVTRKTARDMALSFTGRDISFEEWSAMNPDGDYGGYRAFVNDRRVHPTEQATLYKDVKEYMRYILSSSTSADRALGYLKALTIVMYLGGRVSSAAVNLTNMFMAVPATISAHAGISMAKSFKEVGNAGAVYGAYRSKQLVNHGMSDSLWSRSGEWIETKAKAAGKTITKPVTLTKDDENTFDIISEMGWDQAHFNVESIRALQGYASKRFNDFMGGMMYMFGAAEKCNRATTIFAAYKAFDSNPKYDHLSKMEKLELAHDASDNAHGIYGAAAKPKIVREHKSLDLWYTFLKFQHNYMINMIDVGIKRKNIPAAMHLLLSSAVLSGAEATIAITGAAFLAKMFGISDDPIEDVYAWLEEHVPPIVNRAVQHGAFGLMNLNFKGSLQMNNPFPTKLVEVLGAPGGVGVDLWDAAKHLRHKEYRKAVEKAAPTFIETPLKGLRYYTEGVTTKTYSPTFYGTEQLKADELDLFMMMFSFNTAELSGIRQKQYREKKIRESFSKERQDILRRMKHIYLKKKTTRVKALAEVQEAVDRYNLRVERAPARYQLNSLTGAQLRRHLKRAFKPSKFERERK